MIRFACPKCQSPFSVADSAGGKKTSCPRCGQRMLVPYVAAPVRPQAPVVIEPEPLRPQVVYVNQAPPARSESYQEVEHSHRSRTNLWMIVVGIPLGILLLTITFLLISPFLCCGIAGILGSVKPTEPSRNYDRP